MIPVKASVSTEASIHEYPTTQARVRDRLTIFPEHHFVPATHQVACLAYLTPIGGQLVMIEAHLRTCDLALLIRQQDIVDTSKEKKKEKKKRKEKKRGCTAII